MNSRKQQWLPKRGRHVKPITMYSDFDIHFLFKTFMQCIKNNSNIRFILQYVGMIKTIAISCTSISFCTFRKPKFWQKMKAECIPHGAC